MTCFESQTPTVTSFSCVWSGNRTHSTTGALTKNFEADRRSVSARWCWIARIAVQMSRRWQGLQLTLGRYAALSLVIFRDPHRIRTPWL